MVLLSIEGATSVDKAIEIISPEVVQLSVAYLRRRSQEIPNRVIVSIEKGGGRIAEDLERPSPGIQVPLTRMRMQHKDEQDKWQKIPRLIYLPEIDKLIDFKSQRVRELVFAEAVVEGEDTIKESKKSICTQFDEFNSENEKHYPYPNFHTIALISKINGAVSIDDFISALEVSKKIYVAGYGCDDGEHGRDLDNIIGRLADGFEYVPPGPPYGPPYYTQNF